MLRRFACTNRNCPPRFARADRFKRRTVPCHCDALGSSANSATNDPGSANRPNRQSLPQSKDIVEIIFWKIDYLDRSFSKASNKPWDKSVTERMLTLMLAVEY